MNSFEKFYFNAKEFQVGGSGDSTDFCLEFSLRSEQCFPYGDPYCFRLRVRGKEEFRKVMQRISAIGEGMLSLADQRDNERTGKLVDVRGSTDADRG